MNVTCKSCKQGTEIVDPADDGWLYDLTPTYAFTDNGERYVEKREGERTINWKCNSVVPTEDNPNAFCGVTNTITEAWNE